MLVNGKGCCGVYWQSGTQSKGLGKMIGNKKLWLAVISVGVAAIPLLSQVSETKPSFEVASVKPNKTGDNRVSIMGSPGGRYVATGVSLRLLMGNAYRVRDFQIIGGPDWMASDRWDIEARAEEGSITPQAGPRDPNVPDPMSLRMQSLLEDRFQLKFHRETRELPVYELTVAKSGSKVKLAEDQTPIRPPERGTAPPPAPPRGGGLSRGSMRMGFGDLEAVGIQFPNFVNFLSQQVGRAIVDKTGLSNGFYDIKLKWTPEFSPSGPLAPAPGGPQLPPPDPSGASIFTALQEQLGLRLESTRGPVEVLVIDSVQRPVEN
jgi:uncharacterized protein (TIGR03435 family)